MTPTERDGLILLAAIAATVLAVAVGVLVALA